MILAISAASLVVRSPAATAATTAANALTLSLALSTGGSSKATGSFRRIDARRVHAHADRAHVAGFRHFDRLARDLLGLALEQVLQEHGRLVARSARAAGRIAALAFLKLHDLILLFVGVDKSHRARGRACARVLTNTVHECGDEKSPRRLARASYAVLVNNGFLEDSVTRSQAFSRAHARRMRAPCKQQEKNRDARIPVARMSEATCGAPVVGQFE